MLAKESYVLRQRPNSFLIPNDFLYRPDDASSIELRIRSQIERITGGGMRDVISEGDAARVDFGDDIWEGVLTFDALKDLLSENRITIPTITEDEINDRSKGDTLSKGIARLQLICFIAQIISRSVQGLAITELELTTAALAGLNSVMFIFWWGKPRNVRFPIVIRTKGVEELLVNRTDSITWRFADSNFDIRIHLWTSCISWVKYMANYLNTFLVSFLATLKHAVTALPHYLYLQFSNIFRCTGRSIGDSMGYRNTELKRTRATDKEDDASPDVLYRVSSNSSEEETPFTRVSNLPISTDDGHTYLKRMLIEIEIICSFYSRCKDFRILPRVF